jgi:hypothetical protein
MLTLGVPYRHSPNERVGPVQDLIPLEIVPLSIVGLIWTKFDTAYIIGTQDKKRLEKAWQLMLRAPFSVFSGTTCSVFGAAVPTALCSRYVRIIPRLDSWDPALLHELGVKFVVRCKAMGRNIHFSGS